MDFDEGPIAVVDETRPGSPPGKSSRKRTVIIGAVALVAVLAMGFTAWWFLSSPKQVEVPDLRNKSVENARLTIAQTQFELREEEQEDVGSQEGVVIGQDPAPGSKVLPGSPLTIFVAVAPKYIGLADVSGRWDSSTKARYDVITLGADFFFRSLAEGPQAELANERGSGSVSAGRVTARWRGSNGERSNEGRVEYADDRDIAQIIHWNNGVIWFRPEVEGSALVRHFDLDQYDRAKVLEAIRKGGQNNKR